MSSTNSRLLAFCMLVLFSALCAARPVEVPPDLEPWKAWVLDGEEFRRCPFIAGRDANDAASHVCAWPERLVLDLDARGGHFSQRWMLFHEAWLVLPGDQQHWPRDVRVDGNAAAVVAREGLPQVWLGSGSHTLSGGFTWSNRPEALTVPAQTGIVELTIDGTRIAQPERPNGTVWLGKRRGVEQQQQMELQVYRRLIDEIPVRLETLIRVQVAGEGREELLAPVLPEGFTPTAFNGELPARLEPDGRLRVQVRPGSWELTLTARGTGIADSFKRPAGEGPWAREEVWSFESVDRLRVAAVEGVEAIDPAQANVPDDWRELPSYRMASDSVLKVVERSRGLSAADENRLTLQRNLWRDFAHDGWTALDTINGTMRQGWRLDMEKPYQLMSARIGEDNILITMGADEKRTGIELREPNVYVEALSRIADQSRMPALGWQSRFDNVNGTLHLPPGHRLLAALGADEAPETWISRWRILDLFLVLIVSVAVARLFGWAAGAIALVGLALSYQDSDGMIWLWLNLLLGVVLAREAPEGRLRTIARVYRNLSFAALLIMLVPFVANQVRLAIYPQLDVPAYAPEPLAVTVNEAAPAEAPPAAQEADRLQKAPRAAFNAPESKVEQAIVTASARLGGLNAQQVLQRYAPGTLVQTGPGIPSWSYYSYSFSWSGPVEPGQSVRFVILPPVLLAFWRVISVALLVLLLALLTQQAFGWPRNLPRLPLRGSAAVLMLMLTGFFVPQAHAAEFPDPALLTDLKARLTRAPDCAPTCAELTAARVNAVGDTLDITLEVSALESVAVPVPAAAGRWEPEAISIDGVPNGGLYRDSEQNLWVALRAGAHTIRLSGRLVAAESVQVVFPQTPRTIEANGTGWEFSGVNESRLLTNTLELIRKRVAGSQSAPLETSMQFPTFVRVTRTISLDLDWTISTLVERLAPEKGAFTVAIPLLKNESVLTEAVKVRDGKALIGMPAGQHNTGWNSGLARGETLELESTAGNERVEIWKFRVSPQWNVSFEGTPAILPENLEASNEWSFEYHPRAGEKLVAHVSRPQAAKGATLAIDSVYVDSTVGNRSTEAELSMQYRSTQGGRHTLKLPTSARVTSVEMDGNSIPLRPENGELVVSLLPGSHRLTVNWLTDTGIGLWTRASSVDAGNPASNIRTTLTLPPDRWVLLAFGKGVGPVILFWGELAIFIVAAVLLGRSRYSPLRTTEWLLLGLGLSTFSWSVLLTFAVWMFLMRWRSDWQPSLRRRSFNTVQVLIGIFSVIALISLVSAIPYGLLGMPDMRVHGVGQQWNTLSWFLDQSGGQLPRPGAISVSIWWYRLAMLAWAMWLSFALWRWVRWAWQAFNTNGLWRGKVVGGDAPPPNPPSRHAVNPG